MDRQLSKTTSTTTHILLLLVIIGLLALGAAETHAYERTNDCEDCHGGFRKDPYTSLSDGARWSDSLHNVHRNNMLNGDCGVCHTAGSRSRVYLGSSDGGTGMSTIGCVGCHGRESDMGNDSVSAGRGAGLRQLHSNAGTTVCQACHSDANPASYTPVAEDVLPDYYANPGSGHPQIPEKSCNPIGTENFAGTSIGLDNDGDGQYDKMDADCAMTAIYNIGGTVSGLVGPGLVLRNNGGDDLAVDANGAFEFTTQLGNGDSYLVTVKARPAAPKQVCSISNGSGTMPGADVSDVQVTCSATLFQINAGLNDAWYNPITDGQGAFITVFPVMQKVALSWFTYDTQLPPVDAVANLGNPGHRWFNALGQYVDNEAVMNIQIASGGIFDTTTDVTRVADGTIILTFDDCNAGTIEYDIPSIGQSGVVPIQRVNDANIALCESLAAPAAIEETKPSKVDENNQLLWSGDPVNSAEATSLVDMNPGLNDAWYYPVTDGQGFFITVFPDIQQVAASWFTYDTSLPPGDVVANLGDAGHRWFNAVGSFTGNSAAMTIKITSGGIFDTATEISRVEDGTILLTFTDCNNGTVEYSIPSIGQSGIVPISRVVGDNIAWCESFISP